MLKKENSKFLTDIFYKFSQKRSIFAYAIFPIFSFTLMLFCTKSSPLFSFNDWYDANVYFTMGKGLMNGRVPYVDLIDNKGPLLYLMYGIAWIFDNTGFFGVYLFQSSFVAISVIFVYRLSLLFIKNEQIAFFVAICSPMPMLVNCFYAMDYNFGGGGPDEFCRSLMIVSLFYFTLYYAKPEEYKLRHTLIQGSLFMCVCLMKFNLAVFWVGFLICIAFELVYKKKFNFLLKHITGFVLSALITILPYIIYGIATKSLSAFWNTYFLYNKIYVNPIWNPVIKAFESLISALGMLGGQWFFSLLFSIGLVFVFLACKTGFKVGYSISLFILFTSIYFTTVRFATIHISFTVSLIFGIIALGVFVERYAKNIKKHKFIIIQKFIVTLLIMAITIFINDLVTYEFFLSDKQTTQQQIAEIICQRTKNDSPTLLEIDSLDSGFYTAAGIIPDEPFFFIYNIRHEFFPYPRDAQKNSIEEGYSEFAIISTTEKNAAPNTYNIRRLYDEIHVMQGTGYQSNLFYHLFQLKYSTSFDENFENKLISVESNVNNPLDISDTMHNNDNTAKWFTGEEQQTDPYLIFEFKENVTYNTVYLDLVRYHTDNPINLIIFVSIDGNEWQEAPLVFMDNFVNVQFEVGYYRYIKFTLNDSADNWWSINEIYFGYTEGGHN